MITGVAFRFIHDHPPTNLKLSVQINTNFIHCISLCANASQQTKEGMAEWFIQWFYGKEKFYRRKGITGKVLI